MTRVESEQRQDAEDNTGSDFGVRKEESSDAGEDRGEQEQAVPWTEEFTVEQTEEDNESGSDAYEADDNVHDSVSGQAHTKNHWEIPLFRRSETFCCPMALSRSVKRVGAVSESLLYPHLRSATTGDAINSPRWSIASRQQ